MAFLVDVGDGELQGTETGFLIREKRILKPYRLKDDPKPVDVIINKPLANKDLIGKKQKKKSKPEIDDDDDLASKKTKDKKDKPKPSKVAANSTVLSTGNSTAVQANSTAKQSKDPFSILQFDVKSPVSPNELSKTIGPFFRMLGQASGTSTYGGSDFRIPYPVFMSNLQQFQQRVHLLDSQKKMTVTSPLTLIVFDRILKLIELNVKLIDNFTAKEANQYKLSFYEDITPAVEDAIRTSNLPTFETVYPSKVEKLTKEVEKKWKL
jgi:hypothetical protein